MKDTILADSKSILSLEIGTLITKRNLFDLIQYSKQKNSKYWSGDEWKINNTPQQGINWIGSISHLKGVLIKTKNGSYEKDGWVDDHTYRYSFKSRNGIINLNEKANFVLIDQVNYLYPVLLFTESKTNWLYNGAFTVVGIEDTYVELQVIDFTVNIELINSAFQTYEIRDNQYTEGGRKYALHNLVERNMRVVKSVKNFMEWLCDICGMNFSSMYGKDYIEAHHKIPISRFNKEHQVTESDFVLLCPNCHKAVHLLLKDNGLDYEQAKLFIINKING